MSRILSRRDLDFMLEEWLGVSELVERDRFRDHTAETFAAALDLAEEVATKDFAPHNAASDQQEPYFDGERVHIIDEVAAGIATFAETGLLSAAMDADVGGSQLPLSIQRACFAWFQAANIATASYSMLTMANANLLCRYGDADQVARFVRPMLDGRATGTMCLSESQAGSSLADVLTQATPQGDGSYRLRGNKMWISGGDHDLTDNIVHLVLARVAGAPRGVAGLSLFVVPKFVTDETGERGERNDVVLAGVNHKMGYRGTVNTVLNFGDGVYLPGGQPGAVGHLVGEEGQGLALMFHMMNEARIAVGAGAAALGYTGYLHALEYARERPQGRLAGQKDPSAPQVAIVRHPDVRRMLLAAKSYAEGGLALVLFAARLVDDEMTSTDADTRAGCSLLLEVLTPIVKSWPSQWCLAANDLAIQVHGGYGYTREYPVEQFYRDNRLNPIHEGTFGIQALDLLGRKVRQQGGAALALLLERMRATADTSSAQWAAEAGALRAAVERLDEVTATLWADGQADVALANAGVYLEAAGHVVLAWIWLDQMRAADDGVGPFYDGKRAAARYFFRFELPRVHPQFDLLETRERLLLDLDDSCL